MNKKVESEYSDKFKSKIFEYIINEPADCKCASDRHTTERFSHNWPCETHTRKCDFGLKYPETLNDIAARFNRLRTKGEEFKKLYTKPNPCPLIQPTCDHKKDINDPKITCGLCRQCCLKKDNAILGIPKQKLVEKKEDCKSLKDCLCEACKRNKMEIEAIRNDPAVVEDDTGLEYFIRQQQWIHRLQDEIELCRIKLQPNYIEKLIRKDEVCMTEKEVEKSEKISRCHKCGDLFDDLNVRVACKEEEESTNNPRCYECLKKHAYEVPSLECTKAKEFKIDCEIKKKDCNKICGSKRNKCLENLDNLKNTNFVDKVCKQLPKHCENLSCRKDCKRNLLPCKTDLCKHMKHLLHHTPSPGALKLPTKLEMECLDESFEKDNDTDAYVLKRQALTQCSDMIPDDKSFDYYLTAPDIHKLRYMQNEYMTPDDWYTVY